MPFNLSVPHIPSNLKTTLQGILSLLVIVGLSLQSSLLAMAPSAQTQKTLTIINVSLGIAKAVLGFFQQDAGTTVALVPGVGVQTVPSHEVPDSPAAIPVIPVETK